MVTGYGASDVIEFIIEEIIGVPWEEFYSTLLTWPTRLPYRQGLDTCCHFSADW